MAKSCDLLIEDASLLLHGDLGGSTMYRIAEQTAVSVACCLLPVAFSPNFIVLTSMRSAINAEQLRL